MRLSEAIRLGSMLAPQGFGEFISGGQTVCALGAAMLAVGDIQKSPKFDVLYEMYSNNFGENFGLILQRRKSPPCGCSGRRVLGNIIIHLNDSHKWTREQIADWVEQFDLPVAKERRRRAKVIVEVTA